MNLRILLFVVIPFALFAHCVHHVRQPLVTPSYASLHAQEVPSLAIPLPGAPVLLQSLFAPDLADKMHARSAHKNTLAEKNDVGIYLSAPENRAGRVIGFRNLTTASEEEPYSLELQVDVRQEGGRENLYVKQLFVYDSVAGRTKNDLQRKAVDELLVLYEKEIIPLETIKKFGFPEAMLQQIPLLTTNPPAAPEPSLKPAATADTFLLSDGNVYELTVDLGLQRTKSGKPDLDATGENKNPIQPEDTVHTNGFAEFVAAHPGKMIVREVVKGSKGPFWAWIQWDSSPMLPVADTCARKPMHNFLLAWNANGSANEQFGEHGVLELNADIQNISRQQGGLLVAGLMEMEGKRPVSFVKRYTWEEGKVDSTFANQGTLLFPQARFFHTKECGDIPSEQDIFVNTTNDEFVAIGLHKKGYFLTWYDAKGMPRKNFGRGVLVGKNVSIPGTFIFSMPKLGSTLLRKVFFSPDGGLMMVGAWRHPDPAKKDQNLNAGLLFLYDAKGRSQLKRPYALIDHSAFVP